MLKPQSRSRTASMSALIYRNFIAAGLLFFVLISLLVSQPVAAKSALPQAPFIDAIGYLSQRQNVNYAQAKQAFEEQEYAYAFRLMKVLAENGHHPAQYYLATMYDMGLGSEQDEYKAYRWYRKAAMAGMSTAQHNLAVAYARGLGVKADINQAIKWWKLAAKQGHTDSQFNLGILYATGKGLIAPDLDKAQKWWHMAAVNGDAAAQFNLGALYANGLVRPTSSCEAIFWLQRSEKNGFKQAHIALTQIEHSAKFSKCK